MLHCATLHQLLLQLRCFGSLYLVELFSLVLAADLLDEE